MELGEKIKRARQAKNLTQQELGDMIGVQKSAIAKYENGRVVNIKKSTLQKLAKILGLRVNDIIEIEESPSEMADLHARIITDFELLDMIKDYYDLSEYNKNLISGLIKSLKTNHHL